MQQQYFLLTHRQLVAVVNYVTVVNYVARIPFV